MSLMVWKQKRISTRPQSGMRINDRVWGMNFLMSFGAFAKRSQNLRPFIPWSIEVPAVP